jgi:hypothetical protein
MKALRAAGARVLLHLSALALASAVATACHVHHDEDGGPTGAASAATGHPRLWIRQQDVPRLQSWATSSNPMYANGLKPAVDAAVQTYDTKFFPNGQENPSWPDMGTPNWEAYDTEAYAEMFAFMSLVDPDPAAQAAHGQRARNLLMHVMNEAVKGVDTSSSPAPFRASSFPTYNRANYWGEAFGLTLDWAYPYFSAQDKATIQKVFLRWADECVHASTTSEEHPQPVGVLNDPSLLADKKQLRWAANNYFTGHMRHLTLMSLALDPADDPPVDPSQPVTQLGNSMQSYLADVTGAWLYQQYAVYTDAATAASTLGVSPDGLGVASGGLSVEGFLYGESLGALHEALLALHTAGYDDPALSGPQAALVQSPYWDRFLDGFLHSMAPIAQTPTDPNYSYLGPVTSMASYGDILRFWIGPEFVAPFGTLGVLDQTTGNTARLPALRWIAENAIEGGAGKLYDRAAHVWGNSYATYSILYFMLFDPSAPAPADPRPGKPLVFTDGGLHRVLARTDWTPNATWFDYLCNWQTINHQVGSCNEFELWRKGEWLTKERTGYSNDGVFMTSDYHNTLALQNDTPNNLEFFEVATSARGGQWTNGQNAGDPTVRMSNGGGWVYAFADSTNLYNRPVSTPPGSGMDIAHASRDVVWLSPDHVVVYDRAESKTANRFKRWNLTLLANPSVSGNAATVTTAGGQRLTIETLLPAGATLTASAAENFDRVAELEPTQYRLVVEDPTNPTSIRFLHVLEAADAGVAASTPTLLESTSGAAFQGATVAGAVVMFPVDANAAFGGTSWVAPTGTTLQLLTGLAPGGGYTASVQASGGGILVTVSPGGSSVADSAGVLVVVGSSQPPPPPPACTYALAVSSTSIGAPGGAGSTSVIAPVACAWTAQSNASWITVTAGNAGAGNGTVSFAVDANAATSPRTGTITIAGLAFTVSQPGASAPPPPPPGCTFGLSPTSAMFGAAGGASSTTVSAPLGCAWTAQSNAPWITVTSGSSGSGDGAVGFSVSANTAASQRTGTITIAGQTFTVTQDAAATTGPCAVSLPITSASFAASGGMGTVTIEAPPGCSWIAESGASWIWESQPVSGAGDGSVSFTVLPNSGAARVGTITIGGQVFTVVQAGTSSTPGPCAVMLGTTEGWFSVSGGTGTVDIQAPAGCSWEAESQDSWIWSGQPTSGSGDGTYMYTVIANSGPARTGSVVIGGQTLTVHQDGQ